MRPNLRIAVAVDKTRKITFGVRNFTEEGPLPNLHLDASNHIRHAPLVVSKHRLISLPPNAPTKHNPN